MPQFTGFAKDDFAVYTAAKWSSMVHNLPRMRNKDRMLALCDAAAASLEDSLAGLARAASDEIPNIVNQKKVDAQWVYWFRDAEARANLATFLGKTPLDQKVIFNIAPQDKHVTLAVIMRQTELWVGLRLSAGATVDRRNFKQKIQQSWERQRLLEVVHALPSGALVGFEGEQRPAAELTEAHLLAEAEQLDASPAAYLVGIGMEADDAVAEAAELADYVRHWLEALVPIYRVVAWTRDNDLIEAGKQIQEEKAQKRRQATAYASGDRVRVIGGLFAGKQGTVLAVKGKAHVRVMVGTMAVVVPGTDLAPVR